MKTLSRFFKNSVRIAGTSLTAMLLNHISSDDSLLKDLSVLGGGSVVALESMKLFSSLAPNLINNWIVKAGEIQGHEKNHDIEYAIRSAYEYTFELIEKECFNDLYIAESFWEKFGNKLFFSIGDKQITREILHDYFFGKLLNYFISDTNLHEFIVNNHQLDLSKYIEQAFTDTGLPELLSVNEGEQIRISTLFAYFKESFMKYFPQGFVQELKNNDKAKTAYFKIIMELTLERIAEVKQDTHDLKISHAEIAKTLDALRLIALRTGNDLENIVARLATDDNHIRQAIGPLPQVSELIERVDTAVAEMEMRNYWIPNLTLGVQKNIAKDKSNIFEYNTRYIPFLGRSFEISALFNFLDSNGDFLWWMVAGPGGIGKSRLAMEFCFLAKKLGYFSGFYKMENSQPPDNDKRLGNSVPIFMVIDYSMADKTKTLRLLTYLQDKINTLKENGKDCSKVRVLLLDRGYDDEWKDAIGAIKADCYNGENDYKPLLLQTQEEDLRWEIIEHVIEKETGDANSEKLYTAEKNKTLILTKLEELDNQKRPLFAFFAAESLAYDAEENIRKWNQHKLLEAHLNRLRFRVWMKRKGFNEHQDILKKLLVLNTLTRNLTRKQINCYLKKEGIVKGADPDAVRDTYYALADHSYREDIEIYHGLQPDILGEYFIIKTLEAYLRDDETEQIRELLEEAWETNAAQTSWTCSLMYQDYFLNPDKNYQVLEKIIFGYIPHLLTQEKAGHLATLFNNLVSYHGGVESATKQDEYLAFLRQLHNAFEGDEYIAVQFALALSKIASSSTVKDRISPCVTDLQILGSLFRNSYLIKMNLALGLCGAARQEENSAERFIYTRQIQEICGDYYNRVDPQIDKLLAMARYLELEIAERSSLKGYYHAILSVYLRNSKDLLFIGFLSEGLAKITDRLENTEEQLFYLDKLRDFYSLHQTNPDVANNLADGLVSFISLLAKPSEMLPVLEELRNLFSSFSKDNYIGAKLARGIIYLVVQLDNPKEIAAYIDELEALYTFFPLEVDIARYIAKGCYWMISKEEAHHVSWAYLQRVRELNSALKEDEEIAINFAKGIVNITNRVDRVEHRIMLTKLLRELCGLPKRGVEFSTQLAMGICNVTVKLDQPILIAPYLNELNELWTDIPGNYIITLCFAKGLANIIYRNPIDIVRYLDQLMILYVDFTGDLEMASTASLGLMNASGKLETEDLRIQCISAIRAIVNEFKTDNYIALNFAKGLHNVIIIGTERTTQINHLQELISLTERFDNGLEFVQQLCASLCFFTYLLKEEYSLENYTKQLRNFHSMFSGDARIALLLSASILNTSNCSQNTEKKLAYINELGTIQKLFPGDLGIALQLAAGLSEITFRLELEYELGPRVQELRLLNHNFPDNSEIALQFAKGLANMTMRLKDTVKVLPYLTELRLLRTAFADDAGMALQLANGLNNLSVKLDDSNDVVTHFEEVGAIFKAFENDFKIAVQWLYALAIWIELNKANLLASETAYLPDMENVVNKFPADENAAYILSYTIKQIISYLDNASVEKAEHLYLKKIQLQLNKFSDSASIASMLRQANELISALKSGK